MSIKNHYKYTLVVEKFWRIIAKIIMSFHDRRVQRNLGSSVKRQ